MKPLVSVLILVVFSNKLIAQPVISSFSPQSAAVGTTITILGSNFNPVLNSNIVSFGNMHAVVTDVTATSIQAIVPSGATNQPISVTDISANVTGFSSANFLPVFNGGATLLTTIAQSGVINTTSGSNTIFIKTADLDGDGKPDLIASYTFGNIGLFLNTSTPGNLDGSSFSSGIGIYSGIRCTIVAITDMNGDGKPDLITYNQDVFELTVWQNQSVPGTIAFSKAVTLPDAGTAICVGDIDGDGRPDIIQMDIQQPGLLKIIKNNSAGGILDNTSFDPPAGYNGANGIEFMAVQDLDGDGKPEIITCNRTDNTVSVFRNTAVPGIIDNTSLDARVDYPAGKGPFNIAITDIDDDGKADLIVSNTDSNTISILKNLSTTGTINSGSFAAPVSFTSGSTPDLLDVGDLDGDGKPDIAVCNANAGTISVFKNIATAGVIDQASLAAKSDFTSGSSPYGVAIADLDGDGKPEITVANQSLNTIAIFQTTINHAAPVITKFTPDTAGRGQTVAIHGNHLSGTSVVLFGDSAARSFTATADTLITAIVGGGLTGKIHVTTSLGSDSVGVFTFIDTPVINSVLPLLAGKGDTIVIHGQHLLFTSGVNLGGAPAASFLALSDTILKVVVAAGNTGTVQVTTPYGITTVPGFVFVQPPVILSFSPQVAAAGQTVNIHGKNLQTTQTVYFGGTPATIVQMVDDTMVVVKIGSGSNGDILLDNIGDTVSVPGFTFIGSALITSFSPALGPKGTIVTINGNNFSSNATDNIVHFGAVTATVVSGGANNLTVIVPAGANFLPVSVTAHGTTAWARNPFGITFASQDSGFNALSFSAEQVIATDANPYCASIADLDGDGKPELTIGFNSGSLGSTSLSILQNTGSPGVINFSQGNKYSTDPVDASIQIAPTDLDGDGKLDLAIGNGQDGNAVSIFQNNSTPGNSQLSNFQILNQGGPGGFHIATGDLDGDGRPDIAVTSDYYPGAHIYRNISSGNHIAYSFIGYYPTVGYSGAIIISDLDGDGKADIAVATDRYLSVFKNNSTVGNIVLDPVQQFDIQLTFIQQASIAVADMDQDGKPDLVTIGSSSANMISIFQNNSSPGAISFKPRQDYTPTGFPGSLTIADFNGDGKPDVAVLNDGTPSISLFRNTSSGGNISLATPFNYAVSSGAGTISSGDLDGDSKPEIIVVKAKPNSISIFRNLISDTASPVITSFSPAAAKQGDTVTIIGTHLTNTTAVKFGGIAATIVKNSDTLIRAIVGAGASGFVKITTNLGVDSLAGFDYLAIKLLSFTPDSLATGGVLTIRGKHLTGVSSVLFGGTPAASYTVISDSVISAVAGSGSSGYIKVISPLGSDSLNGFKYFIKFPRINSVTPLEAGGGTTVTIRGIYLTGMNKVTFGGVPAVSSMVVSDSVLTAVTGTGASGYVAVFTDIGSDSLPGFVYDSIFIIIPRISAFSPSSGSTDSIIIIRGKHLNTVSEVSFGETDAASFTILSDSVIRAVVGSGSSGFVTISTATLRDSLPGFTFVPPSPHINSFTPAEAGGGAVITIRGIHLTGANKVTFGGMPAASFIFISDSLITAVTGTGSSGYVAVFANTGTDSVAGFKFDTAIVSLLHMDSFSPSSGSTDSVIIIKGKHLSSVSQVTFGGTDAASFSIQSDSVITAVVGAGSSGFVAIKTPTLADSLSGFTFVEPALVAPHINNFSPDSGQTGTVILITGTGFTNASGVSFGNTPAAGFTVQSDTEITAEVGTGATGYVEVTTAGGTARDSVFHYISPLVDSNFAFLYFGGKDTSGQVSLLWSVKNDMSVANYAVQHGQDSLLLNVISTQPANQKNGIQNYFYSDVNPFPKLSYYRIQITDTNGYKTYSKIITMSDLDNVILIYPNPARNYMMVMTPNSSFESMLRIMDQSGKTLKQVQVAPNVPLIRVDLTGIIPGVYTVSWTDGFDKIARQLYIQF